MHPLWGRLTLPTAQCPARLQIGAEPGLLETKLSFVACGLDSIAVRRICPLHNEVYNSFIIVAYI